MARAKIVKDQDGRFYGIRINCPGCQYGRQMEAHILQVDWTPPGYERSRSMRPDLWTFNGDLDYPVFGPSLLVRYNRGEPPVTPENIDEYRKNPWTQTQVPYVCHSFIGCNGAQPGQIVFLGDCTHHLKGQIVDLPSFEEAPDDGN